MLVGHRDHGIRRPQDFTAAMAEEQARDGWLTDNQYLAILANPDQYQGLVANALPNELGPVLSGDQACLFMCRLHVADLLDFEVQETYGVTFRGTYRLSVQSHYNELCERRTFTMRYNNEWKLVHYRPNNDAAKLDKVRAKQAAQDLDDAIKQHGTSSGQTKRGVLDDIRAGRGGGAPGPS